MNILCKAAAALACAMCLSACAPASEPPEVISADDGGYRALFVTEPEAATKVSVHGEGLANRGAKTAVVADGANAFAANASALILNATGDVAYSPCGLYLALAAMTECLSDEAAAEVCAALGCDGTDEAAAFARAMMDDMSFENNIGHLRLGVSLWLNAGFNINTKPLASLAERYGASVYRGDFGSKKLLGALDGWLGDYAGGLGASLTRDALAELFAGLDFRDEWTTRFDESATSPGEFTRADGSAVTVDFMRRTFGSHGYVDGDGWLASSLPLKNGGAMWFVLPDGEVDALLDSETLAELFALPSSGCITCGEVRFAVPKLDTRSSPDLTDAVKRLGVKLAMTESSGAFAPLTDFDTFAQSVRQSTAVALTEKGVSASSYTQITFYGAAMPDGFADMTLDRPFLYFITGEANVPIIAGVLNRSEQ